MTVKELSKNVSQADIYSERCNIKSISKQKNVAQVHCSIVLVLCSVVQHNIKTSPNMT